MSRTIGRPQAGDEARRIEQQAAVKVQAQQLHAQHDSIRKQLDILRKTRAQRGPETIIVPPEFRAPLLVNEKDLTDGESTPRS